MSAPKRVQMTRNKPWRAEHPDAVIVDRRTKWGNPFVVGEVAEHWHRSAGHPYHFYIDRHRVVRPDQAVGLYRKILTDPEHAYYGHDSPSLDEIQADLRGRDLACWCKPGDPCHADVLLELANQETA